MKRLKRQVPNMLSAYRIAIIPVLMFFFYMGTETAIWINCALFFVACWSDYFDGKIARKTGYTSAFGKFLDTTSDKVMIGSVLLLLIAFDLITGYWVIPALILFAREIIITNLRGVMGVYNVVVESTWTGKYKAFAQMVASGFLMAGEYGPKLVPYSVEIGKAALIIATVLSIVSAWDYVKAGLTVIKKADKEPKKK